MATTKLCARVKRTIIAVCPVFPVELAVSVGIAGRIGSYLMKKSTIKGTASKTYTLYLYQDFASAFIFFLYLYFFP